MKKLQLLKAAAIELAYNMQNINGNPFYIPELAVNAEYKCPITEKIPPLREFNINGNKIFAKNRKQAIKIAVHKGFIADKKKGKNKKSCNKK